MATTMNTIELKGFEITFQVSAKETLSDYGVDGSPQFIELEDLELTYLSIDGTDIDKINWPAFITPEDEDFLISEAERIGEWELEEPDYEDDRDDWDK